MGVSGARPLATGLMGAAKEPCSAKSLGVGRNAERSAVAEARDWAREHGARNAERIS
jgi:hypothetical protein